LSHKDEDTREALASELAQLKDKYSRLEQAYNALKDDAAGNSGKSR